MDIGRGGGRRMDTRANPHEDEVMESERITKLERQVQVLTRQLAVMKEQQEHRQHLNKQ